MQPPNVVEITLTRGQVALIDAEDYDKVKGYKWKSIHMCKGDYAYTQSRYHGQHRIIYMHKLLMDVPDGMVIDHINHIGTDNRKNNLRVCTVSQNNMNRSSSGQYKGVSFRKDLSKWHARICKDKKCYHIGFFPTPEDAAHAYDREAQILHGDFALLNFPQEANHAA
jgi:hypothetical protein